jgi:hypothetical protein
MPQDALCNSAAPQLINKRLTLKDYCELIRLHSNPAQCTVDDVLCVQQWLRLQLLQCPCHGYSPYPDLL